MSWGTSVRLPEREIEKAKEYWRAQYDEVFAVLQTRGEDAIEALAREAYCQKPAKTNPDKKGGARDVAIWLSVIDYLKKEPGETVYFVSSNYRDFSDGVHYPAPMSADLGEMKSRLSLLTSFEDFVSRFTEKIEIDSEHVKSLLTSLVNDSLTSIESSAQTTLKGGRLEGTRIDDGSFEIFQWQAWIIPPSAVVRSVSEVSGHKIADAEWYTATVDWILVGIVQPSMVLFRRDISAITRIACEWRTKVLFGTGETPKLRIVDFGEPKALDPQDRAEFQPLIESATRAFDAQSSAVFGALSSSLLDSSESLPVDIARPDLWHSKARLYGPHIPPIR